VASVNIFAKNEFEEEIFYVIFFFLFILYYYLPFLDGSKKKTLHVIFAFNSNSPQIEHIYKKYKHKEKK